MKRFSLVVLSVLFFLPSVAVAMDLAEMQKIALANRQVVQQFITEVERGEKGVSLAKGGYLPSVDLSYTVNSLDEASTTEHEENSILLGQVRWNVFNGFRDKYSIRSAEILLDVDKYKLDGVKQDLQLGVALAYLSLYERRANHDVAKSAYQTLEKVYRDGDSRFQVGLIGKNELLKFRVDFDNADITLKAAEGDVKKSVNTLSREIGQWLTVSDLDFVDFSELPQLVDIELYRKKMLENRSEIKALEAAVEASSTQVSAEKSGYYPQVDLAGSYRKYDNDYISGNGDSEDEELRAQLVLSMNLFNGLRTEAAIARAKLATRSAKLELRELKNSLTTELDNLFIDFQVSLENVTVAKRSIEQAEENLRITQLKYEEGLQRESDLLDAITSLSRAKYNHVAVVRTAFLNNFRLTRMVNGF